MKKCTVEGCSNKHEAKGYCNKHYLRLRKHGDPNYVREPAICGVDGCDNVALARGYCGSHYRRLRLYGAPLADSPSRTAQLAFVESVVSSPPGECVIWPFSKTAQGYGEVRREGRRWLAHRLTLALHSGGEPKGMRACHGPCHNRLCVNPTHLSWQTGKQNSMDRDRDGTMFRGERSFSARLTEADVRKIRASNESSHRLSEIFPMAASTIRQIRSGRSWAHVVSD